MKTVRTRSRRHLVLCLLLIVCLADFVPGKDKWAKKSYLEWTEEEALQVLTDSPWSKAWIPVVPRLAVSPASPTSSGDTDDAGQHSNCCRTYGSGIGRAAADPRNTKDNPAGNQPAPRTGGPAESFRVSWFSSMHVRQALYRLRLINGAERDPATELGLVQPADRIVLAVFGPSMRRFQGTSLALLRASTRLESRKNRGRVADLLDFVAPETRADHLALFVFARTVDGRPVFDAEDKELIFSSGEGQGRITVAFKLKAMSIDGALDY